MHPPSVVDACYWPPSTGRRPLISCYKPPYTGRLFLGATARPIHRGGPTMRRRPPHSTCDLTGPRPWGPTAIGGTGVAGGTRADADAQRRLSGGTTAPGRPALAPRQRRSGGTGSGLPRVWNADKNAHNKCANAADLATTLPLDATRGCNCRVARLPHPMIRSSRVCTLHHLCTGGGSASSCCAFGIWRHGPLSPQRCRRPPPALAGPLQRSATRRTTQQCGTLRGLARLGPRSN